MIICPQCKHQELSGALYCSQCGAALFDATDTASIRASALKDSMQTSSLDLSFPTPPPDMEDHRLALRLIDLEEVIFLKGDKDYTIGRASEGQTVLPDVDLAPFQAYEAGVSRLHALLGTQGNHLTIQDLGSSNGTRLNGQKIPPHAERSLANGDILTLGKLKLQILVRE